MYNLFHSHQNYFSDYHSFNKCQNLNLLSPINPLKNCYQPLFSSGGQRYIPLHIPSKSFLHFSCENFVKIILSISTPSLPKTLTKKAKAKIHKSMRMNKM